MAAGARAVASGPLRPFPAVVPEARRQGGKPRLVWLEATEARPELGGLWKFLEEYLARISEAEFEPVMRAFPVGTGGVRQPAARLLNEALALAVAKEVEPDADLVIYNDWAMPVYEARSLLSIPVTGLAEASAVIGGMLARRPAIVTVAEGLTRGYERDFREMGTLPRMTVPAVWALDPPSTHEDVLDAIQDPAPLIDRFDRVAKKAVEAGADAILVGCGYFGPVFAAAGYLHVSGRPDVPVYDCSLLAYELGRMLHGLHRWGLGPSQRSFAPPKGGPEGPTGRMLRHLMNSRQAGS